MESTNNYSSLSCQELANALALQNIAGMCKSILLVDVRPSAQHLCKHIATAENVNFSSILLRRLSKGVADLKSLLHYDHTLHEKLASRNSEQELLVLYDSCSTKSSIRTELVRHGDVLAKTKHERQSDCKVYFLDGGYEAFSAAYPQHCASSTATKRGHSPLGISVSASLPIFPLGKKPTPTQKLCTPSEDSSRFGPPVQILPHLVLGSAKDSGNLTQLRKMGVTSVLNVSNNCPNHFESVLEYKCIAVEDSYQADLLSKMDSAIEFINSVKSKGGCVFVHCHAGISRSATISISYIMKTMGWDLHKAYEFVKHKRPCISPNLHFMGQLLEFEKQLKDEQRNLESDTANFASAPSPLMSSQHHKVSSPFQPIPVPKHLETPIMDECDNFFCSSASAIPSASAPSSLTCEQTEEDSVPSAVIQTDIMEFSPELKAKTTPPKPKNLPLFGICQSLVRAESNSRVCFQLEEEAETKLQQTFKPTVRKPTSLPLLQVKSHSSTRLNVSEVQSHRLLRQRSTPVQTVASLPTTPDNPFRNHTLSSSSSSISSTCSSVRLAPPSHQNSPCRIEALLGSGPESPLNFSCNNELSL